MLVLCEPLLELLGLVEHDPCIVREAALFLVGTLAHVRV